MRSLHDDRALWIACFVSRHLIGTPVELLQNLTLHLQFHLRVLLEDLRVSLAKHFVSPTHRPRLQHSAAWHRWIEDRRFGSTAPSHAASWHARRFSVFVDVRSGSHHWKTDTDYMEKIASDRGTLRGPKVSTVPPPLRSESLSLESKPSRSRDQVVLSSWA